MVMRIREKKSLGIAITIAFLLELPLSYAARRMSLLPPSFALIVVGGRRRSTPFVGGEEEGAAWCLPRRCQHPRFPPLTIDGRSEVISPNTPIEAPCEPMLRRKD